MSTRRRNSTAQKTLTSQEIDEAAPRMMAGAQAHQRASVYCADNPDAKPPNVDALFFLAVSFELILNSIEQSLRLILLIQYSSLRPIHNIYALYKAVLSKSGGKEGIRSEIVNRVNTIASSRDFDTFTESEILKCLRKHDSSYSSFWYFGLDDDGRATMRWEFKEYETKLLHYLALALIDVNLDQIKKFGFKIFSSMSVVLESELTG